MPLRAEGGVAEQPAPHQKRASGVMEAPIQTATQRRRSPPNATKEQSDRWRSGPHFAAEKQRKDLASARRAASSTTAAFPASCSPGIVKAQGELGPLQSPHELRVVAMSTEGTRACNDELSGRIRRAYTGRPCATRTGTGNLNSLMEGGMGGRERQQDRVTGRGQAAVYGAAKTKKTVSMMIFF